MTRTIKPDKPGSITRACNLKHFSGTNDDANAITDDDPQAQMNDSNGADDSVG